MKNSFLDTPKKGEKILIIVPHEDDEINLTGNIIYAYAQRGAEIFCVFTTNGDYSWRAKTRQDEAVRSLRLLGAQHVIFLGYGDTYNDYAGGHVFDAADEPITSPAGHQETYGTREYPDYALQKRGKHSPYCHAALAQDLQDVILDVQADLIFCVDCDYHCDHRAASLIFEEVMGHLLRRPGNIYRPIVFKGFAYNLGYHAAADFYADNILSAARPEDTEDSLIDTSLYEWDKRVRFPVRPEGVGHFLRHNIIYQALFQHASQSAGFHAIRVANGDTVFWQRRTDNLAYQAEVTASSGEAEKAADFQIVATKQIKPMRFIPSGYLWQPAAGDVEKKLVFHWHAPQTIRYLSLWGNIENEGKITSLTITFDSGYQCVTGPLPDRGRELSIMIPEQKDVKQCTIQISGYEGTGYGLSEVGFYAAPQQKGSTPILKLQIEGQFAYHYLLPAKKEQCQLGAYSYPISFPVQYKIIKGEKSKIDENGLLSFPQEDKEVVVRVEAENHPEIYDEITLTHVSAFYLSKQRFLQGLEKHFLNFYLKKYRKYTHIRHKYLKKI